MIPIKAKVNVQVLIMVTTYIIWTQGPSKKQRGPTPAMYIYKDERKEFK